MRARHETAFTSRGRNISRGLRVQRVWGTVDLRHDGLCNRCERDAEVSQTASSTPTQRCVKPSEENNCEYDGLAIECVNSIRSSTLRRYLHLQITAGCSLSGNQPKSEYRSECRIIPQSGFRNLVWMRGSFVSREHILKHGCKHLDCLRHSSCHPSLLRLRCTQYRPQFA